MVSSEPNPRPLVARWLGRLPYRDAWALQRALVAQRKAGEIPDTLLLLEHDPVISLGSDARREHIRWDAATLEARGIDVVESDRGGDVTYHGPGQLIGYLILDLKPLGPDVRRFVRRIEAAMIATAADFGVSAERRPGAPGVWLEPESPTGRKLGAIGARLSRWVTHHGLALNVNTDLAHYEAIVPCGITDRGVTSLARELGHPVSLAEVAARLARHLADEFGLALESERVTQYNAIAAMDTR